MGGATWIVEIQLSMAGSRCLRANRRTFATSRLLSPLENAATLSSAEQGWCVATSIQPSLSPGAGNGRFINEAVPAGTVVSEKPIIPMAEIRAVGALRRDQVVTFASTAELEDWVWMNMNEGDFTRVDVLKVLEHFLYGLPRPTEKLRTLQPGKSELEVEHPKLESKWPPNAAACLNVSSWCVNHAAPGEAALNLRFRIDEYNVVVGETLVDVPSGTELRNDYSTFEIPQFYLDYCEENRFEDVRTSTLRYADTAAADAAHLKIVHNEALRLENASLKARIFELEAAAAAK